MCLVAARGTYYGINPSKGDSIDVGACGYGQIHEVRLLHYKSHCHGAGQLLFIVSGKTMQLRRAC